MIGGERSAVQDPLIKYATEIGWKYVSQDEALRLRGGKTGFVFKEIFINQMQRLNPFMDHIHAEEIIKSLERIPPNIEGNFTAWKYLKVVKSPGTKPDFLRGAYRDSINYLFPWLLKSS